MEKTLIGHWAFIIGMILAVLAGFVGIPHLAIILAILGLIVGFLNVGEKESIPFLISVIALMMIGLAGLHLGERVAVIMQNFLAFVSAAGLVVAIKQILVVAKPGTQV